MKKINHIVVATDFSATSRNAYRYATQLAMTLGANLTLAHAKEHPIIVSDVMIAPFANDDDKQLINDIEQLVKEEDARIGHTTTKPTVKIKIIGGDADDALIELSKQEDTDLIVIGSTGLADVLTNIFGSTSISVSNKAHCPVILVPRGVKWQPIERILFASNYDSMTREQSQHIFDFAAFMQANIHFVNIRNYDPPFETKQKDIDWDQLISKTHTNVSYEKHTLYGNNTVEELNKYSDIKNISLMAFVSKHRNFLENLMHNSVTENITLAATLPILVMHLDDEPKK